MKKVEVGDTVVVSTNYSDKLGEVIRVTPAGSFEVDIVKSGLFNANGRLRGDTDVYHPITATLATEEDIKKIREGAVISKAVRACHNLQSYDITYEQAVELLRVLNILKG